MFLDGVSDGRGVWGAFVALVEGIFYIIYGIFSIIII